jgi:hypothetical protein
MDLADGLRQVYLLIFLAVTWETLSPNIIIAGYPHRYPSSVRSPQNIYQTYQTQADNAFPAAIPVSISQAQTSRTHILPVIWT